MTAAMVAHVRRFNRTVTQVIAGATCYSQPPLEPPADGTVLICVAEPTAGIVGGPLMSAFL
jgi:hypothetical protein